MFPRIARLWVLVVFALLLQVAVSQQHARLRARQENENPEPTVSSSEPGPESDPEPTVTGTRGNGEEDQDEPSTVANESSKSTGKKEDEDEDKPTSTTDSEPSKSTDEAAATDGPLNNSTYYDVAIPDGELPLRPELTPGFGVAGTVMILTGLLYTLVGIKNRYIHTFFSTAFMVALGISVLIVYVMSTPVSHALQGGYVAAITLSGCALGVASIFFKELTEGLACALGGFSVSMWLLCLVPGGLLSSVTSKAIFISCFTLVAFAFYFSRYTRDWALITMISFAGGTVVVLGIDCFSRAGLKEFWAYVWELNNDLFPLGADTYPVTKGIRVETAAIIILALFGVISQIKLWRIVRLKKEERAAARAQDQRNLEQEEADVGRQVEAQNARERREWERVHGNGDVSSSSASRTSDIEKKSGNGGSANPEVEVYELTDLSDNDHEQRGQAPLTEKDEEGKVTVRVAADETPEHAGVDAGDDDKSMHHRNVANADATIRVVPSDKKRRSHRASVTEAPEVVPLPFTVPHNHDDDIKSKSDRSSIATFADEGDDSGEPPSRRDSYARRLSRGSSKLLRNLSPRSSQLRSPTSPVFGESFGESSEGLVGRSGKKADDESSVVATLDNESLDGSDRQSMLAPARSQKIEIEASLAGHDSHNQVNKSARSSLVKEDKRQSQELQAVDDVPDAQRKASEAGQMSPRTQSCAGDGAMSVHDRSEKPKSTTSGVSSRVSLTKDHLPRSLSRVALSYRTNEWAKHLSYADAPEPDELQIAQDHKVPDPKSKKERSAPVNVDELQQAVDEGAVQPALGRSGSRVSLQSVNTAGTRRDSKSAVTPPTLPISPSGDIVDRGQAFSPGPPQQAHNGVARSASSSALRRASTFETIAEEQLAPNYHGPIPEELDDTVSLSGVSVARSTRSVRSSRQPVPGVVSYSSPQTLLAQREMFLRSKSQGNLMQTPEPYISSRPTSDAGSILNYPRHASAQSADPDDVPLSQRKQMIHRNNSMMSLSGQQPQSPVRRSSSGLELAGNNTPFNSHQPQRNSQLPSQAAREAQLANFRHSVAQDLHAGTPMMTPSGRETPFASTNSLLGGREAEVQRSIQMQRNMLLSQKEAEAQRKEMHRQEKEWVDRAFDERMRSGELLDAHREAMKKLQQGAKSK